MPKARQKPKLPDLFAQLGPRCSRCGNVREQADQRYCRRCANAYMRTWRKTHPMNEAHRKRDIARSIAHVTKKRGGLKPKPCEACGSPKAEMHHPDHERPRDVAWLCRSCHLAWHRFWRKTSAEVFAGWLADKAR